MHSPAIYTINLQHPTPYSLCSVSQKIIMMVHKHINWITTTEHILLHSWNVFSPLAPNVRYTRNIVWCSNAKCQVQMMAI